MNMTRKLLALLLCLCAVLSLTGPALAAEPAPFFLSVRVEGGGESRVRAYEDNYPGNLYLSLSDLSRALSGFGVVSLKGARKEGFLQTFGRFADGSLCNGVPLLKSVQGGFQFRLLQSGQELFEESGIFFGKIEVIFVV